MSGTSSKTKINLNDLVMAIVICSISTLFLACKDGKKEALSTEGDTIVSFIAETIQYSDYSTVDWQKVDSLFYRPNQCDWETTFPNLHLAEDFPSEAACEKWHLLQNAKKDFHMKAAAARTINNLATRDALLKVESAFDSVFYYFTKDDFYMRSFVDNYNMIMPKAFDDFEVNIKK